MQEEERYASLMNCPRRIFNLVLDAAMQHNIQFVITHIDGRATDSVKNYHMKFKSDADYELFKQLLALKFGLEV